MTTGPIDRYLDELFIAVRDNPPSEARALLAEAESHLRDAVAAACASGVDERQAEQDAVTAFGRAPELATADRHRDTTPIALRALMSAWWLGAVGAITVGASGVVAGVMRLAGAGNAFLVGTGPTAPSVSDCARWFGLNPQGSSCAGAAANDWAAETVAYRIALGLLGVLALGLLVLAKRRDPLLATVSALPQVVVDAIAVTAFGAAAVALTGLGVDALAVASGHGAGQWLSAAPVAAVAGAVFLVRLRRDPQPAR